MVITVVGLGFVGLTTALGFAFKGHTVYGIETDEDKREMIQTGRLPFYEPFMQEQLKQWLGRRLFLCPEQSAAVPQSEAVFYCVGTPCAEDGSADLRFLTAALRETMPLINKQLHPALVVKSTVPVGTVSRILVPLLTEEGYCPQKDFEVVNNPEFLREGNCWEDFINADRIVMGASSTCGWKILDNVYAEFGAPKIHVSTNTAEFIKYLSNTFLASMISYANEMANFAVEAGDIEVETAFSVLHQDKRWKDQSMSSYVYPGCGYGGYCLPKDTNAMLSIGTAYGQEMPILHAVVQTNEKMPQVIADRIASQVEKHQTIGILGLAFKPHTDDVRDAAAAKIIRFLNEKGYHHILAYDPVAQDAFQKAYPALDLFYSNSAEELTAKSDIAAIITAWPQFYSLKTCKNVIDFRYMRG